MSLSLRNRKWFQFKELFIQGTFSMSVHCMQKYRSHSKAMILKDFVKVAVKWLIRYRPQLPNSDAVWEGFSC